MSKHKRISTALAVLMVTAGAITVAMLCARTEVLAQPGAGPGEAAGPGRMQPPGGPGGRGFGPGGGMMPGMPGGMPMFAGARGSTALTARGDYVYVLRGNTLYQFLAEGLELVEKVTLEEDRPMGFGHGPGMGPERRPDRPRRPEGEPPRAGRSRGPQDKPRDEDQPQDE